MSRGDYYRLRIRFDGCNLVFTAHEDVYGQDNAFAEARTIADKLGPESHVEVQPLYGCDVFEGTRGE